MTDTQARRCGHCDATLLATDAVHYPARRGEIDAGNPLLGTVVDGKYRLQSVLGRGGLGTVFRAQHIGSLVTVALKLLHPRFAERLEYRRALLPEARRAATVTHERCARVLDVGEGTDGITYLAMELVEGQTLDEVLQRGALSPSHALDILLQIAEALAAIHEVGLVHCDLSPRNVMVNGRSGRLEVKVLDFGIARSMSVARREQAPGDLVGFANPAFSAPELLMDADVDARTDIYSLGTLMWLLLTGSMPIDDSDTKTSLAAIREGRLVPWPGAAGVPRRLVRLVQQCLRLEPGMRPASMAEVHRRLQQIRIGQGPLARRIAATTAVAALVVTMLNVEREPPFLRQLPNVVLEFSNEPLAATERGACLQPSKVEQVSFFFGGFAPSRLRATIGRVGGELFSVELTPEVDRDRGSLTLSTAQPTWKQVVEGVLATSANGPVDLALYLPGKGPLASTRLQLDDTPPELSAEWAVAPDAGVRGDSQLDVAARDGIGLDRVTAEVVFEDGRRRRAVLPNTPGPFAVGAELLRWFDSVGELGAGHVLLTARDRAGNETALPPRRFASADVAAPSVVAVSGPAGGAELARRGGVVRGRIELSASESGCRVTGRILRRDGKLHALPLGEETTDATVQFFEIAEDELVAGQERVSLRVDVVDAAGNKSSSREFSLPIRSRDLREALTPEESEAGPVVWRRQELVMGPTGGTVRVAVGQAFELTGVRCNARGEQASPDSASFHRINEQSARVVFGSLAPGRYELLLLFRPAGSPSVAPNERRIRMQVLPAQIEIKVPSVRSRYLRGLVEAGMFVEIDGKPGQYRESRAWRLAEHLRPYVAGGVWVGFRAPTRLPVQAASGALLPPLAPALGRNLFAVALRDVLDRPVRLVDAAGVDLPTSAGRYVIADFWWSSSQPLQAVAPLLVEHGRPARFRVDLPVPFADDERELLVLNIVGQQFPAAVLQASNERESQASFDVPFEAWSFGAGLSGKTREDYSGSLTGAIEAVLSTPAGDFAMSLRVKTTRSKLVPLTLQELGATVPADLRGLRLLPVLAPGEPFVEPVPPDELAPPRLSYRPQVAVDVRNLGDIMLQDREMTWREARALREVAAKLNGEQRKACVHAEDPLGVERLARTNLLSERDPQIAGDALLVGVDFYQAYALTRLLGVAVADDPELFRLPFGCELELAAFGDRGGMHGSGVLAHGGRLAVDHFINAGAAGLTTWTPADGVRVGDLVPCRVGDANFVGLDFGVREWVFDLPHAIGAEVLLRTYISDHVTHLKRQQDIARGRPIPGRDPIGPGRQFGVVRGISFGERGELMDLEGKPLPPGRYGALPASVPGVLRTEQVHCDGSSLLQDGGKTRDARLLHIGLRVVAEADAVARLWGAK